MEVNILSEKRVLRKLEIARSSFSRAGEIPVLPGRDVELIHAEKMPKRVGLSFREGQGRLLHDLANIELQAMELCYRTWSEFPDAPEEFQEELLKLLESEAGHLNLCLSGLHDLGFKWGDWPVHPALWSAVSQEDDLIDRVLIVHRYLEGNGLDAGDILLKRLSGVPKSPVHAIVHQIATEELEHVQFGSRWYLKLCEAVGLDAREDFSKRFSRIENRIPHRIEKMNFDLRRRAGFSEDEIQFLDQKRESWSLL